MATAKQTIMALRKAIENHPRLKPATPEKTLTDLEKELEELDQKLIEQGLSQEEADQETLEALTAALIKDGYDPLTAKYLSEALK